MEIGKRDPIIVHQPDGADSRRGEIEGRGRAETAGAETQNARRFQPFLSRQADLRQHDVARIAPAFFVVQSGAYLFVRRRRRHFLTSSHFTPTIR
jgi:hypothetical protein